jgi:hypothetical protein
MVELLRRHIGSAVTVEFTDGEIIDAEILHVDADDHRDFTYDVRRVRVRGPSTDYSRSGAYVMPVEFVRRVQPLEGEES